MEDIVVVFDFDRTILDGDSDRWVVAEMGMSVLFAELRKTMPWTSLMDRIVKEIQSQGKTTSDIANCLHKSPVHPSIVKAIKSAHNLGCDLRIISDANQFFIETILKHHSILECFSHITTNPTLVDEEGKLRISPYQDSKSPHGCTLCSSNMCKGLVIDQVQSRGTESGKKKTFIYLGDGHGDYCPTLRLSGDDHVMPRKSYPLWDKISGNPTLVKAKVHEWTNGEELNKILLHLIDTTSSDEFITFKS